ncbi:MAG: ABC transporter substrate-binding protein [Desulfomonile tiedjei]|uniref:ABC transporter substrate-binding protein n=1 Tax=Desulfomonile tiedjei TaxID=2358 RepID=A0A9D6V0S6_9BACT|nr:ABC transporter substrate-binding protein [Desulfomonile tiedjei]
MKSIGKKKTCALIVAFSLLLILAIILWHGHTPKVSGTSEKVTLGTVLEFSSLIWVAEDRGFFSQSGLDVKLNTYGAGVFALRDLLASKADFATCSEFVFVRESFAHKDLRVIATIDKAFEGDLVARRDSGIRDYSDLRNKRLGLMMATSAEFFFSIMLTLHKFDKDDLEITDVGLPEQVEMIEQGKLDAIITWQPYTSDALSRLGGNGIALPAQSDQPMNWVIVTKEETLKNRPAAIQRLLSAVAVAETFISKEREMSQEITARRLGSDKSRVRQSWSHHSYRLTLDQSLILAMENQASWLISNRLVKGAVVPNFLHFIHQDALKAVNKEAVSIY